MTTINLVIFFPNVTLSLPGFFLQSKTASVVRKLKHGASKMGWLKRANTAL
jgi:hypothetical protein